MKNNTPYKFTMGNKNETKHTPGPWTYRRTHEMSSDHWYVIVDGNGKGPIVDVGGRDLSGQIAEAKYLVTDPKEIEANARLIASAPALLKENQELKTLNDELLDALESAKLDLSFVEQAANDQLNYSVRGTLNKVESAINKAKRI